MKFYVIIPTSLISSGLWLLMIHKINSFTVDQNSSKSYDIEYGLWLNKSSTVISYS